MNRSGKSYREGLVSIVLPVKNQEDHIGRIIRRYIRSLNGLMCYEILIVVNASTDGSIDICRDLESKNPFVRVFDRDKGGWGRAVLCGIAEAKGEFVCFANSARTAPEDVARVLKNAFENEAALVKGERIFRDTGLRRLASRLYNLENLLLHGIKSKDVNGTPKVLHRDQLGRLNLREVGDLLDLELMVQCRKEGVAVVELPIDASKRHGGKSTTTSGSAWGMYWGSFRYWLTKRHNGCDG